MFAVDCLLTDEPISITSSPRPNSTTNILDMNGMKRKRAFEADESCVQRSLFSTATNTMSSSIRGISSPGSGSIALSTPALSYSESFYDINDTLRPQPHPLQRNVSIDSRNSKRIHLAPRPRLSRHISIPSSDLASLPSITSPTTSIVQACHICCRRPSTLQDLPAYNDCESCTKRTCFVCMRTCEGPKCHGTTRVGLGFGAEIFIGGKKVCSRCCVEVGSEGTVWCTTCYQDDSELEEFQKGNKEQLQAESEGRVAEWLSRFGEPEAMDLETATNTIYL